MNRSVKATAFAVVSALLCSCGDMDMKKEKENQTQEVSVDVFRKEVSQASERAPLQIVQRGSLRIDSESIPMTMGRDLIIDTDYLISDGAIIQSFPSDAVAKDGEPGKSAGRIFIRAKSITGTLTVVMQGEKGGKGARGATGDKGLTGGIGPSMLCNVDNGFWTRWSYYGLQNAGVNIHGDMTEYLKGHPATGGKGGVGAKGKIGNQGMPGGDAGTVQLSIPGMDQSQVQVVSLPGEGGDGGDGGEPGEGGDGGPGGLVSMAYGKNNCTVSVGGQCCPQPPRGDRGDQGTEIGDKGPIGGSGKPAKILFNGRAQLDEKLL